MYTDEEIDQIKGRIFLRDVRTEFQAIIAIYFIEDHNYYNNYKDNYGFGYSKYGFTKNQKKIMKRWARIIEKAQKEEKYV